jgi:hypothetical protein
VATVSPAGLFSSVEIHERVRTDGVRAYTVLHDALADYPDAGLESPTGALDSSAQQGDQAASAAIAALPSLSARLRLRDLVLLGHHAAFGELEWFFGTPLTEGRPASEPLRMWYADHREEFDRFFPEVTVHMPLLLLGQPELVFWENLRSWGAYFARRYDRPDITPSAVFAVLARDFAIELAPMLHLLDMALDGFVEQALELILEERGRFQDGWFESLRSSDAETATRLGRPSGPETALLTFMQETRFLPGQTLAIAIPNPEATAELIRRGLPVAAQLRSLDLRPRALPDLPATKDEIGVTPLVDGLFALLNDRQTALPLALAVTAPWGAGKSSVMEQLRIRLEAATEPRRWRTVSFDAWKFEKSERLWAALAKAVYDQPLQRMSRRERFGFRRQLERRRLGWFGFWGRPFLGFAIAAATLVATLIAGSDVPATEATAGGLLALVVGTPALNAVLLLTNPFKRAIDRYADEPEYAEQLGFTAEADADVATLTDLLTEGDDQALAVFVDDLDRCSPRHVVEVVEAINQIFNAAHDRECLFVLGLDRDVVESSIEVAYGDLIARLRERDERLARDFGHRFLAKLVQLSVTVPPPDESGMERLLAALTERPPPGDTSIERNQRPSLGKVALFRGLLDQAEPNNPAEVHDVAERMSRDPLIEQDRRALDEAVRQKRSELFGGDSEDVVAAEFALLEHLPRNPRDLKRFDNAFRLQLHVANGTPGCGLDFTRDELFALGKWVVLRLRWPALARTIDEDPALAGELERHVNDGQALPAAVEDLGLDEDARHLLTTSDRKRRLDALPLSTFLRVL